MNFFLYIYILREIYYYGFIYLEIFSNISFRVVSLVYIFFSTCNLKQLCYLIFWIVSNHLDIRRSFKSLVKSSLSKLIQNNSNLYNIWQSINQNFHQKWIFFYILGLIIIKIYYYGFIYLEMFSNTSFRVVSLVHTCAYIFYFCYLIFWVISNHLDIRLIIIVNLCYTNNSVETFFYSIISFISRLLSLTKKEKRKYYYNKFIFIFSCCLKFWSFPKLFKIGIKIKHTLLQRRTKNGRMHRLLIISRPRILFENNAPFPLYRSYVFPSPQTCSFRFIFLVPGCFPFLRLFIFLLAPSPCFLSSLAARFPSFHFRPPSLSIPLFPSSVSTPHLLRYLSQFFSPPILIPPFLPLRA